MADTKNYPHFKSMEKLRYKYLKTGRDYELAYNGQEFFLSHDGGGCSIATNRQNKDSIKYGTIDEMLDNFKETGGKTLREFILEAEINYEY